MKKLIALPLAAFALAACSEYPTSPSLSAGGAAFDHTDLRQAGGSDTWHGYHAPEVTAIAGATFIGLDIVWNDDRLDDVAPDHINFEIRWSADGENWDEGEVRDFELDREANFTIEDLEENTTYFIEVKGHAKHGKGQETSNHHSEIAELEVSTAGVRYTVVFTDVPGQAAIDNDVHGNTERIDDFNANSNTWGDVQFRIRLNNLDLTTCEFAAVEVITTFNFNGGQTGEDTASAACDAGLYTLDISNEAKITGRFGGSYPSIGTITVEHDGSAVENIVDYESS